jgi:hydroxyacylglutathione hydrolase
MFVQELKAALDRGDDLQILDVRRRDEYDIGHIEGAKHIFVPELRRRAGELDKDRPIVAYCRSGFRSSIAASVLQQMGFKDVRNVPGSMKAWLGAGYETSKA